MTTPPPPMPNIVGRVDSRTGEPATVETPREYLAAYVCPRVCQYAEEVGVVHGAGTPPCPGGYCAHYAPTGADS